VAALLGLSIALTEPASSRAHTLDNNYIAHGASNTDTQVGATVIALTQETGPQSRSSSQVSRRYISTASWYRHGRITANGERYDPRNLTAAHKTLPFNTLVRLTNPETNSTVVVRINDRGPYIRGREFDLSMRSAQILGFVDKGVTRLIVEVLKENKT